MQPMRLDGGYFRLLKFCTPQSWLGAVMRRFSIDERRGDQGITRSN
jgi:hypothetical protein